MVCQTMSKMVFISDNDVYLMMECFLMFLFTIDSSFGYVNDIFENIFCGPLSMDQVTVCGAHNFQGEREDEYTVASG